MSSKPLAVEQILILLAEGPPRIAELTAELAPAQLHTPPNPGEWAANEVLAHLRSCADVWGDCMVTILNEDTPTIRAVNPRTWIEKTEYLEQEFHASLRAFVAQRNELMAVLKPLTAEAWSRKAKVTGAGKPLERTVQFYAEWLATHERPHIKQIKGIVKAIRSPDFLSLLSGPARSALEHEGILTLAELSRYSEREILALHGVGPKSLPSLRQALHEAGLGFAEPVRKR